MLNRTFICSTIVLAKGIRFVRVPTVREKSVKSEKSSRSGKSQGILI